MNFKLVAFPHIGIVMLHSALNDMALQVRNENGETDWVHRAYDVCRLVPRRNICNTQTARSPLPSGEHIKPQGFRSSKTTQILPKTSTKQILKRQTREQLATHFKDFIMH